MNKKFLIAIVTLLMTFVSCCEVNKSDYKEISGDVKMYNYKSLPRWVYVVTIDSCEYIAYGENIIHKCNCKFCKEREIKETSFSSTIENMSDMWD